MTSRPRAQIAVLSGALAVGLAMSAWMAKPPELPKRFASGPLPYTISKETTWITEPLRPDGAVDYVAALNARLSEGVTPENNATVLLMQVMGSGVIEPEIREEFYRLLGVPLPETTEGTLQSYWDFLGDYLEENEPSSNREERQKEFNEKSFDTYSRLWTREEFPIVAKWLDENEQVIELIVAASKRPQMYVPVLPDDKDRFLLDSLGGGFIPMMRSFSSILASRSMLSIADGNLEKAQSDLLALHRLAALMANGPRTIDFLVGGAMDSSATGADLILAQSQIATSAQLAKYRKELAQIPRFAKLSTLFDLYERYVFLDWVRLLVQQSREPDSVAINPAATEGKWFNETLANVWARYPNLELDWDLILKMGNARCNQVILAINQPTFAQRKRDLARFDAELRRLRQESEDPRQISLLLSGRKPARNVISYQFGHEVTSLMLGRQETFAEAEVRYSLKREMILIVLALAEYQRDHGRYPALLSELSPRYLDSIPLDAFAQKPFKYLPEKDGFKLYSVGANGQDDNGRHEYSGAFLDEDAGKYFADDIAIRFPTESKE